MVGVPRPARSEALSLVAASAACVLVAFGSTRGLWPSNVHNGVLGTTLSLVGAWLLAERPRSREGVLFLSAGLVEAVVFAGRQVGHTATGPVASWLAWFGVWPIAVGLLLTTLAVICFPDGHLPSRRWRPVAVVACALAGVCAVLSALWPVEWASAGVTLAPPFSRPRTPRPRSSGGSWPTRSTSHSSSPGSSRRRCAGARVGAANRCSAC